MPNPKRKHTRSRRDSRRAANWRLDPPSVSLCKNCGGERAPHRICRHCGFYAGELVLARKVKKTQGGESGGGKA